jgi:hypothetical protein
MTYSAHFKLADDLIAHLTPTVKAIQDPFLQTRYTGFVSVAAVCVYELAVKEILCSFGEKKHKVLGSFTRSFFDRINGRIQYRHLHEDYIPRFGDRYTKRFKSRVSKCEKKFLRQQKKSVLTCYNNIITWRNSFSHEGQLPAHATYDDAIDAYEVGKQVLECLALSMKN